MWRDRLTIGVVTGAGTVKTRGLRLVVVRQRRRRVDVHRNAARVERAEPTHSPRSHAWRRLDPRARCHETPIDCVHGVLAHLETERWSRLRWVGRDSNDSKRRDGATRVQPVKLTENPFCASHFATAPTIADHYASLVWRSRGPEFESRRPDWSKELVIRPFLVLNRTAPDVPKRFVASRCAREPLRPRLTLPHDI